MKVLGVRLELKMARLVLGLEEFRFLGSVRV